ncbi:MAG: ACT domain-containing protein [Chloroherpetonaceae bacterium]|nr:ACT domain-containing protein [Chloroherpetonaceae bacterium]
MSEVELRKIIDLAIEELGDKATKENVAAVVTEVIESYKRGAPQVALSVERESSVFHNPSSGRMIVTAFGKNSPGIVSVITTELAKYQCDLQDVSQKIMQDLFTLIMLVDISKSTTDFQTLKKNLNEKGAAIGVQVFVQHEDIFRAMHRV